MVVRACWNRPVFDEERRRCTAWSKGMAEGGISHAQEAEREEMARIRECKREAEERQYLAFEQVGLFRSDNRDAATLTAAALADMLVLHVNFARLCDSLSGQILFFGTSCSVARVNHVNHLPTNFSIEEQMMREGLEARQREKEQTEGGHGNVSATVLDRDFEHQHSIPVRMNAGHILSVRFESDKPKQSRLESTISG